MREERKSLRGRGRRVRASAPIERAPATSCCRKARVEPHLLEKQKTTRLYVKTPNTVAMAILRLFLVACRQVELLNADGAKLQLESKG
jgi:hypothetical protein